MDRFINLIFTPDLTIQAVHVNAPTQEQETRLREILAALIEEVPGE